jgi:DNA-binding response OmpR family regulator
MKKILIIEDEKNLARFVSLELEHEGYQAEIRDNGRSGLEEAIAHDYDLILLDLMLPELDGFEVARRLRLEKQTPLIMMTARDSVMDRVAGLDRGADDYIVKPFAIEELLARIRTIFRRIDTTAETENSSVNLHYRDLTLDRENRTVIKGDKAIVLSKREYDLLFTLMQNINKVVTRQMLIDNVWQYENGAETNVVDVYVRYLRNKIDEPGKESYIQTVRGMGYVMRDI